MNLLLLLVVVGACIALVGNYRSQIDAMKRNPVTRVRIIPRTMYDDVMGVDWVSESK